MLLGRFWLIVPVLAIAGSLAAQEAHPAGRRDPAHPQPLFVALLMAGGPGRGALTFIPALALGPIVEHLSLRLRPEPMRTSTLPSANSNPGPCSRRPSSSGPLLGLLRQARTRSTSCKNPVMFTVWIGSALTTVLYFQALVGQGEAPAGVHPGHRPVAVVHPAVRQLRRGHGRRAGQGPGGAPAQGQARRHGQAPQGRRPRRSEARANGGGGHRPAHGRHGPGGSGRHHPRRTATWSKGWPR